MQFHSLFKRSIEFFFRLKMRTRRLGLDPLVFTGITKLEKLGQDPVYEALITLTRNAFVAFCVLFCSSIFASNAPECGDDECSYERENVLNQVFQPLVSLGKLTDVTAIKNYVFSKKDGVQEKIEGDWTTWHWPRRQFKQVLLFDKQRLSIEISTESICIRREHVEKVFKEAWLVKQTPGQWFAKDRQSNPLKPHNGSMSFREDKAFRFIFGFEPSGCSHYFQIFSENS